MFLHHSQTSNSKMKCYHLHKTRYPSCVILIDFTTISIYNIPHSSFQASPFLTFHKQNFRLLISNFLNQFLYLFICQIAPDIYENKYLPLLTMQEFPNCHQMIIYNLFVVLTALNIHEYTQIIYNIINTSPYLLKEGHCHATGKGKYLYNKRYLRTS